MLEKMSGLPEGIEGLKAIGKVSKEDYDRTFEPMLNEAQKEGRRVRVLYELGAEFEGFTPGGAWEDAKMGLTSMRQFEGCAIVSDREWLRAGAGVTKFIMPCPVRAFSTEQRDQAVQWLASLPEGSAISHRLLEDSGVIVVEVKEALRARDFDALAETANAWIQTHGELQGLVIHAHAFPGWENLDGLVRHIRFVRDHQRKVNKIALAADSKLASLAPLLAEHFIKAEIRSFPYDSLDSAIAWAATKHGAS